MASYAKTKGRESSKKAELRKSLNGNSFTPLRHDLINSSEFMALSIAAKAVLVVLLAKYNGYNNGDLSAPQNRAKEIFGLSPRTLKLALDELVDKNFLIITRQGGKNQCTLYALTCFKLNTITKKNVDIVKETFRPLDSWKTQN
ncbi:ArsR family transcriptional regulator [Ursidibacter sp. B-7004-1]